MYSDNELELAEATNNEIFDLITQPSFNDTWRDHTFDHYKSLGDTCTFKGRGIIDSDKKRELTLNQFFTPYSVVKFMTKALALDETDSPVVYDNSCGIGRMFRYLPETARLVGIEIEDNAYKVAKALFPNAQIAHANLVDYTKFSKQVDVAMINPPFSIIIERENMQLENASWGKLGPGSSIKSHIAALELAIRAAKYYVIAFLPQGFFENEDTVKIDKWIQNRAKLVMKIDIPANAFSTLKDNAFNWPCCIALYDCSNYYHGDVFTKAIGSLEELEPLLTEWRQSDYYNRYIKDFVRDMNEYPSDGVKLQQDERLEVKLLKFKRAIPETGRKDVKICLDANASQLHIKCYDLLAALKAKEFMDAHGKSYDYGDSIWVDYWWTRTRRSTALYDYSVPVHIKEELEKYGLTAEIDDQLRCYMLKLKKWHQRQEAKFEQWIRDGDDWKEIYEENGITSKYAGLYYQRRVELERALAKYPKLTLWDWQKEDVARASMKDSVLLASDMGLGKTRQLISLALLRGHKRNLIIVESRLIGTFVDEFKKVGISDYQIIGNQDDLQHLKLFNLISYSKLWRPISNRTKKTFAKALRKRFKFIAADEVQNIKAKDSRQAIAVRSLKAKHKVLATGTPVMNYPRNIFSLLVFGWGDGTELNPYGYYTPFFSSGTNSVTSGTKAFKDDFIVVEWVTPQFEETLDRGRKQREMPKIKDIDKWYELMAPKMIRRVKEEPKVRADVKIPEPVIEEIDVKPSKLHLEFYKAWLLDFAEWFEEQMRLERDTYGEHRMKGVEILAQLSKLQFASTIPQSPRVNDPKIATWNGQGMTEKQKKTIELAMKHVRNGEKVIIYSERPEFQKFMHDEFIKIGIRSLVFTGQQTIKKRGEILSKFKRGSIPILLATTTTAGQGLNLPEASAVVIADRGWVPAKITQAFSRILRPEQQKEPKIYILTMEGMLDMYEKQLHIMKSSAINEGIDYVPDTYDTSTWMSYKDFSLKMLKEEGLM